MVVLNVVAMSLMSSLGTRWLIKKNFSPVRASSLMTLFIITVLTVFNIQERVFLSAVVLGGTFVGMNDLEKISTRTLLIVSLLFSMIFVFILPFNKGLGGALGLSAFLPGLSAHLLRKKILISLLR